ncbi:hypothetical protein M527_15120 [Sphingobium indicum IP26]|uniref:hypothetical protein n=1 Tax=Sphingobium indicum TaxID=332055 RepID=UPI000367CB6E|nr:hypothetical protein [Sphingobium indicum]EPR17662.1 hypothetical protein M527_15120 [Sphingobium indicum IP26]
MGYDPDQIYEEVTHEFGQCWHARIDAPAAQQLDLLRGVTADKAHRGAGHLRAIQRDDQKIVEELFGQGGSASTRTNCEAGSIRGNSGVDETARANPCSIAHDRRFDA